MKSIQSLFSVRWVRYASILVVFLTMAFFMAAGCDDDCGFDQINFTPVVDEAECIADCEANLCDDCDFEAPNGCTGSNCDTCEIFDDDDVL